MLFSHTVYEQIHCVKNVQVRSFCWPVFSCNRTEYRKIRTRKNSIFGHFSRSDCGSQKNVLAASQFFLHRKSENHCFGSSHHNGRIEAWWSQFRRLKSSFIIDMFKDLAQSGYYNCDDKPQRSMAHYCFGPLIQSELECCKEQWNSYYIRKLVSNEVFGRPDYLYFFYGQQCL